MTKAIIFMLNNIELAKLPLLSVVRQRGEVPERSDFKGVEKLWTPPCFGRNQLLSNYFAFITKLKVCRGKGKAALQLPSKC